jgi:hypothetical protein
MALFKAIIYIYMYYCGFTTLRVWYDDKKELFSWEASGLFINWLTAFKIENKCDSI